MLVHDIVITDKDIEYAEKILLNDGQNFDDERKNFIKDLSTLDLQAVPGSGKTTVLLAKLLILEKYLPFDDGSGIVVISHTNTAVDEIKNRIEKYCPKLFSYPNFVGTIDSFVNKFLALPYYRNTFVKDIISIDKDLYDRYLSSYRFDISTKNWLDRQYEPLSFLKDIRFDKERNLISKVSGLSTSFKLKDKNGKTYKALKKMKENLLEKGILHYDDTYFLANEYIHFEEKIIEILRKRFCFICIDEMQDMAKHQYELLEEIFYNNNSRTISQRIGDKNQAIFNGGDIETNEIWKDREKLLKLTGTNRLSKPIAIFVQNFGLAFTQIQALQDHCEDLKPHIYLYDDTNIEKVIPTYSKQLKKYLDEGKLPKDSNNPFKAVSWRKEHKSQTALKSYYKEFEENHHKTKETYNCLKSYLIYFKDKKSFKDVQNNLINAFLEVLRLEDVKDDGRYYTKEKLKKALKAKDLQQYDTFNLNIFKWSKALLSKADTNEVYVEVKEYLNDFLGIFNSTINESKSFIENSEIATPSSSTEEERKVNIYDKDGFDIHIATVHSVKGETHTATLYMESYYDSKYESEVLNMQTKTEDLVGNYNDEINNIQEEIEKLNGGMGVKSKEKRVKSLKSQRTLLLQNSKMAYVGFSRPTHLLCVAIHKDRFDASISKENFKIIDIPEVCKNEIRGLIL